MENFDKDYIISLIVRMFDDKISRKEARMLLSWLNEKPENKAEFRKMFMLWNSTSIAEHIDVHKAESILLKRISRRFHSNFAKWIFNTAAALFLPLVLLSGYLYFNNGNNSEYVAEIETNVPLGTISKLMLPDSSIVYLNGGSQLCYPSSFSSSERTVSLKGEAYFKVKSSTDSPFYVNTDKFSVCATGTEFNVCAYQSDSIRSVTLLKGAVAIKYSNGILPMKVNDHFRSMNNGRYSITQVSPYKYKSWIDGIMAFRDDMLGDVLQKLSKTYNYRFELKDTTIAKYSLYATFKNESIHDIITLLERSLPVRCHIIDDADSEYLGVIEIYRKD